MFEGARSGTAEQAIEDGVALAEAGFDMLDVGAVAARSGPPVPADEEAGEAGAGDRGLVDRTELPLSADTFSTDVAARALDAGAVVINDIGGAGDPELFAPRRRCEQGGLARPADVVDDLRPRLERPRATTSGGERVGADRHPGG